MPHITNEIKSRILRLVNDDVDVVITEVGGTVGDIEILPFLEAIRQFRNDVGRENVCSVHLTLVPLIGPTGEHKTKPTQHSVADLRSMGIQPDVVVCRSSTPVAEGHKRKISNLCDVPVEAVINATDVRNIYEIPLVLHKEGLDDYVCRVLDLPGEPDLSSWESLVDMIDKATTEVRIGIVGKYVMLHDAYLSVAEALRHAGFHNGANVEIEWIDAEDITDLIAPARLSHLDAIVLPGGFGSRGIEGKIAAASFARQNEIPALGLCLGLQVMVIEAARNLADCDRANSREFDPTSPHLVIDLMDEQRNIVDMGGTMRLGSYVAKLQPGSQVEKAYGESVVFERHRHRYEVNPRYRHKLEDAGLRCSGASPDGRLVEFVELPGHPFYVGTQAHPEFKLRPDRPHPLFFELVGAAIDRASGRNPTLPDL